jgi:ketosteroid isomerase-like protein
MKGELKLLNGTVDTELANLTAAWNQAIVSNDVGAISQFMADDWVLVTPESGVIERARFLEAIESGALTHEAMDSDVLRVRIYEDSAVLTARGRNNGTFQGHAFRADEWITDVFVKQQDGWRCVLTHLTPAGTQ